MPTYFPFDPNPRAPAAKLPPLACDSQFHVFGPPEKYPVRPGAAGHRGSDASGPSWALRSATPPRARHA